MRASEAVPPIYQKRQYASIIAFGLAAAILVPNLINSELTRNQINLWLVYSVVTIGFYFVFGLSGQFAFSQAFMMSLGAYASAYVTRDEPLWLALFGVIIVVGAVATAFAVLVRRARAFYFAIATLALAEIGSTVFQQSEGFTGPNGTVVNLRFLSVFGKELITQEQVFWLFLAVLLAALLVAAWIERSPLRRDAIAARDGEVVANTCGTPVVRVKIVMFTLSSIIAGIAGMLLAHAEGFVNRESFGLDLAIGIFLMLLIGGSGSMWGPVVGAAFYVFVPEQLHALDQYRTIIYGALLVVTIIVVPEGILGLLGRIPWFRRSPQPDQPVDETAAVAAPAGDEIAAPTAAPPASTTVLDAKEIRVHFGGVRAVDGVSLDVRAHEILGIIGPNGSGKSTFLNAITGIVPATGELSANGTAIPLGRPRRVRAAGVLRGFQTPQMFPGLTCLENVALSSSDRVGTGLLGALVLRRRMWRHERARFETASEALTFVGLAHVAALFPDSLTYGQRRLLEVARAIAGAPTVLLLDEPTAGFNATETERFGDLLEKLRRRGITVVVVDHKLDFIDRVCDRVAVFELGELIAVGPPEDVWADSRVMDAYLGVVDRA